MRGLFGGKTPAAEDNSMAWYSEDNTYNDIRDKSLMKWLSEMEQHEDIEVRGGVKLAREYVEYLKQENENLKSEVALRNEYLKKMKAATNGHS